MATQEIRPDQGSSGLLAFAQRAEEPVATYQNLLTTFAIVHTDFDLTVTVPKSGRLLVILSASCECASGGGSDKAIWGLLDASSVLISGTAGAVVTGGGTNAHRARRIILTGLTPGTSFRCKWGHRTTTASSTGSNVYAAGPIDGRYGPATMEVWSI